VSDAERRPAEVDENVEAGAVDQAVDGVPETALDGHEADAQASADGDPSGGEEHHELVALAESDPRSKAELFLELAEAEARRDEYLDDVRRARAEFENYRRRVMRDGAAQRESGRSEVVEPLLEVLDDLDRTLEAAAGSEDATLAKGVELVATKLVQALQRVGLERIDSVGDAFDPNRHEAVQQQPSDGPGGEPTVAAVLRPGYRIGDRVLRAAMVVVAQ
jgi:molecular chaperone GrpE